MRIKLLTFRYSATLGGFDDTALLEFTRDKELIALREHFYAVNDVPHLTCVLTYQDAIVPRELLDAAREIRERASQETAGGLRTWSHRGSFGLDQRSGRRDERPDPAEGLPEIDRVLFNALREWRATQARKEGAPRFVLFTNRQLLEIVARRPDSPTALGHIDGIGPSKVERYAKAVLAILHGAPRPAAGSSLAPPGPHSGHPPVPATADPLAAPDELRPPASQAAPRHSEVDQLGLVHAGATR